MKRQFTLEYWMDEDWYVGRLREVPGIFSQGQTLRELENNVRDAYQMMLNDEVEALPYEGIQSKELMLEL
jgi:predicted RNase H-like HicB family nuclease